MNRPLLVCDCDEVLMHMVVPFGAWLLEDHDIEFRLEDASFATALKRRSCGMPLEAAEVWPYLDGFFANEMHRQYAVSGAAEALVQLAPVADIVILTNIGPEHAPRRTAQLREVGMPYPVIGSRGGKGPPLAALINERCPSGVAFVDDLANHHRSVALAAPRAWRLHMVAEPAIADRIPPSPHAHARIDTWPDAVRWLAEKLASDSAPPMLESNDD